MAFWLADKREGQDGDWIKRFDPRFWTVNFPRPMVASVIATAPDALRVDAVFLRQTDLAGLIWDSVDSIDHPLLAYATDRDYRRTTLSFRWRSGGVIPLDGVHGPTLTIEGRDEAGAPRTWYVRLWNYAEGTPEDADITLAFSDLKGGFTLPAEADPVWPGHIDRMFVSLVAPGHVPGSELPLAEAVEGWVELTEIRCAGHRSMLEIGDVMIAPHGLSIATGFDDNGVQTPARLVRNIPLGADAGGTSLTIARERLQEAPIALSEPAIAVGDGEFGGASGQARTRSPLASQPLAAMRYYDVDRDYLPGIQRSPGRPAPGPPRTLELPAAMNAQSARRLVESLKQRMDWSRDRLSWRTTELDPSVGPGAIVTLPGRAGRWRVREWEWREKGVELSLERVIPAGADARPAGGTDPGRHNPPADSAPPPTSLVAFELPWDGGGSDGAPLCFAAVSSVGTHWSGAALYADHGGGELVSLGPSGRGRAVIGEAVTALPPASPLLLDTVGSVDIELLSPDMRLAHAHARGLAAGSNLALLGDELIQFGRADPLGDRRWRLSALLRARGGTEPALATHEAGERFVLLDGAAVALDPAKLGDTAVARIVAVGRGDAEPVTAPIALHGATQRPPSPVHPRHQTAPDGSLHLSWTRRSRAGWAWRDGVDAPLIEQAELYRVSFGPIGAPLVTWAVDVPRLTIPSAQVADLAALLPGGELLVRQVGSYALSRPLLLHAL